MDNWITYEKPTAPELKIDTELSTPEKSLRLLLKKLDELNVIDKMIIHLEK